MTEQLPSYNAKVNLLKRIDDAASQMGGNRDDQRLRKSGIRDIGAKSTAQSVLNGNNLNSSFNKKNLEILSR